MRRALLVAGLLGLTACSGPGDPAPGERIAAGEIVESRIRAPGNSAEVRLPLGSLEFTMTELLDEVPARDTAGGRAPEGGSVLGVGWTYDFSPVVAGIASDAAAVLPTVNLVVGGRTYALDEALASDDGGSVTGLDGRGTAWVGLDLPVDSTAAREARIEVTFDGLTQTVQPNGLPTVDHGAARALYQPAGFSVGQMRTGCGEAAFDGRVVRMRDCRLTLTRTPWLEGSGWAPDSVWFVVEVSAEPDAHLEGDFLTVAPRWRGELEVTLRGNEPTTLVLAEDQPKNSQRLEGTAVFAEAYGGEIVVAADVDYVRRGGGGGTHRVTWTNWVY